MAAVCWSHLAAALPRTWHADYDWERAQAWGREASRTTQELVAALNALVERVNAAARAPPSAASPSVHAHVAAVRLLLDRFHLQLANLTAGMCVVRRVCREGGAVSAWGSTPRPVPARARSLLRSPPLTACLARGRVGWVGGGW